MSEPTSRHLSAVVLDSLLLGALEPDEERRARGHLEQCHACAQHLRELHTSAEHFQQVVHPRTVDQMSERMEPPASRRPWRRYAWGAAVLFVALLAGLLLLTRG